MAVFFVIGPTGAANKSSQFYCKNGRKGVSVLTQGHSETLRHYHGALGFILLSKVLDYQGNPFTEDRLERDSEKIKRIHLVAQDREHPFSEDLNMEQAGVTDPNLPRLTKNALLVEVLQVGGAIGS